MTNTDDVARLHREGFSIRAIATRLGLSRMKVHRTLTVVSTDVDDDDEGDPYLYDGELKLTPPFRFVGLAEVLDYRGRPCRDSDGRLLGLAPRWLDRNGVSCNELDLYRHCQSRTHEHDDYAGAERVRADCARQLAEAGVRWDGRRWVQD